MSAVHFHRVKPRFPSPPGGLPESIDNLLDILQGHLARSHPVDYAGYSGWTDRLSFLEEKKALAAGMVELHSRFTARTVYGGRVLLKPGDEPVVVCAKMVWSDRTSGMHSGHLRDNQTRAAFSLAFDVR